LLVARFVGLSGKVLENWLQIQVRLSEESQQSIVNQIFDYVFVHSKSQTC